MAEVVEAKSLPANAYEPLTPGEKYHSVSSRLRIRRN